MNARKNIIIFCNLASIWMIFDAINIWHHLMMFLFVGIIPGTNITLTPNQMLFLILVSGGFVISRYIITPIMHKIKQIKIQQLPTRRLKQA